MHRKENFLRVVPTTNLSEFIKLTMTIGVLMMSTYVYCEEMGEPIGLRRLEARPIPTLCIEAQERHERKEKYHRE